MSKSPPATGNNDPSPTPIYLVAALCTAVPFLLPFALVWLGRQFVYAVRKVTTGETPDPWAMHLTWVQYRVVIPGLSLFLFLYLMISFGHHLPGMDVDKISFVSTVAGTSMILMMTFNAIYGYLDLTLKGNRIKKWFYEQSEWRHLFKGKIPRD